MKGLSYLHVIISNTSIPNLGKTQLGELCALGGGSPRWPTSSSGAWVNRGLNYDFSRSTLIEHSIATCSTHLRALQNVNIIPKSKQKYIKKDFFIIITSYYNIDTSIYVFNVKTFELLFQIFIKLQPKCCLIELDFLIVCNTSWVACVQDANY